MDTDTEVETLLQQWRAGHPDAIDRLIPFVYADLRRIAGRILADAPSNPTLQATALVQEVLLRLLGRDSASFESGAHLLNTAARMMRQVLVDRPRRRNADIRGGGWNRAGLDEASEIPIPVGVDVIELDDALNQLEATNDRMAQVVQLRFFVGLKVDEVAGVLGINERTAARDWAAARVWLQQRLDRPM